MVVESADRAQRGLIFEFKVECPDCGDFGVRIAGHHLRHLRNLLVDVIDQFPDLCGSEAGLELLRREQITGKVDDPTTN